MYTRILLFTLISFSASHIMAQQSLSVDANNIGSPSQSTGNVYYANRNEPPRAIEFKERTVTPSYFLTHINSYFNIPSEFTFIEAESNTDNLGMRHRLLQQYYKGIPLEGMGYRVHEKAGFVTSANGKAVRDINLDTQTVLSEESAFNLAVKYLQTNNLVFKPGKKLIVSKGFTLAAKSFSVAFQFDIDVSLIEQWRISIDASDGQVLNKVSLVNTCFEEKEITPPLPYGTGIGMTNYYGNQNVQVEKFKDGSSRLVGKTENGVTIETYDFRNGPPIILALGFPYNVSEFYSSNNTYNSAHQKPAVSAQWAAERAYEYYFKKHNRNSYDNNGSAIKSYVHVGQDLNNAFWANNLLAFGDGSNNNPLVELDVVSHELTHGVTQYEAGLQYAYESGALNESFSDIFGKAVEFYTFDDSATWQLSKHYREGGLRDMSNPNLKDQPDTYAGYKWYTGYEDGGGVHTNSGVQNFWFYLLCKGGSGINDHQVNYSVNAIGMEAAANIAYRNLTEYLSPFSDYLDSRIGSLLATTDLYGKNSAAYQEVDKAWDAVGVIDEPIITSIEVYDITATTVKIKGSLMPRGDTVTYYFEYGTTPAYGSSSSVYKYTDKVEGILTRLQSATKYYLRLVATNENGSTYYSSVPFTTTSLAPLVKIRQTVDVTETTATLYGLINPNSLSTSFYFEYGPTPAFGLVTPSYPMSDTTEFLNVFAPIIDLQPRQTYYYRLVATNGFASSATESVSFFTAVKPVITSHTPIAAPIDAEVTIIGQNFNATLENNLVNFGATRATVLSSSSTELKVKVPAGASLGLISLLDAESGLRAESVQAFVPTFTGEFKKSSLQRTMGSTDYIYQTLVHDMDGDNKPDIVARHYLGFSVFQNVNQGGDITDDSFIRNSFPSEYTPGTLSLIDIDGNGLKDIVGYYQNSLRIYPNLSVPGYIFFGPPVDLPATASLQDIVFNDFDIDGHIDIAGIRNLPGDSSMFIVVRNQNPRGFISAHNFEERYALFIPYWVSYLYSNDLNNDNKPDLFASLYRTSFLPVISNNSHPGVFDFAISIAQDSITEQYARCVSQDLNQDGWKDIVSSPSSQIGDLAILENKGNSQNIYMKKPVVVMSGYTESAIQPGDIDGDGKVDLLVGINQGKFILLKNQAEAGEYITGTSFEKFQEYGIANEDAYQSSMTINDLNGDGRPEVINTYYYNRLSHEGYQMEIWQNGLINCLDPSSISLNVSNYTATIVLPPNTTFDQFEIEYKNSNNSWWNGAYSTTLDLWSGNSYQLRARAKCYLGYTEYYYIDFTTECVDINSFSVTNIGVNNASLSASNLSSFEVQYSPAGKGLWEVNRQDANNISNLLPGTTYDLRFRGRCNTPAEFKYKQFTTLCPALSKLTITELTYNKAVVSWTSNYTGDAILEFSANNVDWNLMDGTQTMTSLIPGKQYFVRGKLVCTNVNSDFIYNSFTTPCPRAAIYVDNITPFSAKVNWIDESNTGSYTLTYSLTAAGTLTTKETSSTSFNLEGLNPGTQYKVSVAPNCINTKDFTLSNFNTVCYEPFNLLATAITHTTAELSWNDNIGGLPYSIDYSISGSNIWLITETSLTKISLAELRPGTEYEARVHITCLSVTAPYVSIRFVTSLYEATTFAPNPTENEINIYPSINLIGNHFSIYDNAGRRVVNGELLNYTIDLSGFSPGIYTLKIDGEKPIKIMKH